MSMQETIEKVKKARDAYIGVVELDEKESQDDTPMSEYFKSVLPGDREILDGLNEAIKALESSALLTRAAKLRYNALEVMGKKIEELEGK